MGDASAKKTIEVEPSPEGPKVRPKRELTPAQLEALKRGREKLAEKRKQAKEATALSSQPTNKQDDEDEVVSESDTETESEDEEILPDASRVFCTIM